MSPMSSMLDVHDSPLRVLIQDKLKEYRRLVQDRKDRRRAMALKEPIPFESLYIGQDKGRVDLDKSRSFLISCKKDDSMNFAYIMLCTAKMNVDANGAYSYEDFKVLDQLSLLNIYAESTVAMSEYAENKLELSFVENSSEPEEGKGRKIKFRFGSTTESNVRLRQVAKWIEGEIRIEKQSKGLLPETQEGNPIPNDEDLDLNSSGGSGRSDKSDEGIE